MPSLSRHVPRPAIILWSLALLLGGTGCESRRPLRIGIVLGVDGTRAAGMAVADVNARGGIDGRRLELRDGGGTKDGSAKSALESAERLAADDTVLAVIGHTNSSASLAAAQVYNARGIVQIAPTTSSPLYTSAGAYSFRLVPSDVHQGRFLADQILARPVRPRLAVAYVNDDYGRSLRRVTLDRLSAAGLTPVYDSPYAEGERFRRGDEIIVGLAHARPDLLLWIGRAYDYAAIVQPLRRALPALEVLGSDGFGGPELDRDTLHRLDGVRYVRSVDMASPDTAFRRFRAGFEGGSWMRVTDEAVLSYDAVMLLAEAIRAAGADRRGIRDWVAAVGRDRPPFRGISGPIAFPAGGDRAPNYHLELVGAERSAGGGGGSARPAAPVRR